MTRNDNSNVHCNQLERPNAYLSTGAMSDIKSLVEKYNRLTQKERKDYTEADTGTKLVLPLLRALGWDIESGSEVKEQQRQLNKPADIVLLTNGIPRIVVELKQITTDLDGRYTYDNQKITYAEQAIRYAWNRRIDWAVLTNFREIRLYNTRATAHEDGLVFKITISELLNRLNDLEYISRDGVQEGRLDALASRESRKRVDEQILTDLTIIREMFLKGIETKNKNPVGHTRDELRLMVQTLIDRFIVIRVAEDRGLFEQDTLKTIHANWRKRGGKSSFARWLRALFGEFEEIYNTTLFKQSAIDAVDIPNNEITYAINALYKYDFSLIDADVLGNIYESYLTKVLMDAESETVQIVDSSDERKKLGIYYTPRHMVSHILDRTLGEKLAKCTTVDEVAKIKVLDPSCGSGSFLIKAFDLFTDWYNNYNESIKSQPKSLSEESKKSDRNKTLDDTLAVISDPEKRILRDNLFGVDVDPQAASIASVNLMLKAIQRNERLDSILGTNIIVGNTLVTGLEDNFDDLSVDHKDGLRPLDTDTVFNKTKFDVVIGNPPYFKVGKNNPLRISDSYAEVQSMAVNVAMMFVHRASMLLTQGGSLGLVIPKMCAYSKAWSRTRKILFDPIHLAEVVDCMEAFENVRLEQIIVIGKMGKSDSDHCRILHAQSDCIVSGHTIDRNVFEHDDMIYLESSVLSWDIANKMKKNSYKLSEILGDKNILSGEGIQSKVDWLSKRPVGTTGRRMLRGKDLARYRIRPTQFYRTNNKIIAKSETDSIRRLYKPHIVCQRIVIHNTKPSNHIILTFAHDAEGSRAVNTVTNIVLNTGMSEHALLSILNSRALSWYAHKFIYTNAIRSMDLTSWYLGRLLIPKLTHEQEKMLEDLGKSIEKLVYEDAATMPKIDHYLTNNKQGTLTLREHYTGANGTSKKILDRKTVGIVEKVYALNITGNTIVVSVDYTPPNTQTVITDKRIITLDVKHRGIRDYIIKMVKKGPVPTTSNSLRKKNVVKSGNPSSSLPTLLKQIMDIKLPAYGRSYSEHARNLAKMLDKYAIDVTAFEEWRERFIKIDAAIDNIVYDAFLLDDQDIRHIERHSRPSEWSNY